ncbi:helix-turn-helix domain-containing protein [Chryseobacterium paridis]|uniref:Helix-turn-helix transcriptional regulator n=1 Tax=Chryseobacterium paridis TaxID=2800328 RepID=A0ABS1FVZ1_9FLAO|nr:helix-turn-helix transcriptional regulator [Chryseobacterium paridis]MBK1896580.1 helix-turn-helix transcriptional regulator [Chryseobacterium paridis]
MNKKENGLQKFNSLSDVHRMLGLPKPLHPLISLIKGSEQNKDVKPPEGMHILNFYKISFSTDITGRIKYGRHHYDFDDGGLLFASPNQIIGYKEDYVEKLPDFVLLIHPDFLLGYPLSKKIKQYGYFSYSVNEALYLSEKEKAIIVSVFEIIEEELNSRIDEFSQTVVIAQIDLLLSYASRFYKRQFITRRQTNNDVLERLETFLDDYFNSNTSLTNGIPTVHYVSEQLCISAGYLSDLLRTHIGQNAQQYIQHKLIEKAKEKLSTTNLSVSEIAFELGFEHSQSFSKLFKAKTKQTPLEFRAKFN